MGASSSKAAQGAARKFPTRPPGAAPTSASAGRAAAPSQQARSQAREKAATYKTDDVPADSINPETAAPDGVFSMRLHEMGIVQPNPTFSPSSMAGPPPSFHTHAHSATADTIGGTLDPRPLFPPTSRNVTLAVLEARRELQRRAEEEFEGLGRAGSPGREFLDIKTVVQMHLMRDRGHSDAQIEERLNLKKGLVGRLGRPGITSPA